MMDAEEDIDIEEEIASELCFLPNNSAHTSQPSSLDAETDANDGDEAQAGTSVLVKAYSSGKIFTVSLFLFVRVYVHALKRNPFC